LPETGGLNYATTRNRTLAVGKRIEEDGLRGVVGWFGKKCEHRLDWFHVARRIARIEKTIRELGEGSIWNYGGKESVPAVVLSLGIRSGRLPEQRARLCSDTRGGAGCYSVRSLPGTGGGQEIQHPRLESCQSTFRQGTI
jgi:hypothetical protein